MVDFFLFFPLIFRLIICPRVFLIRSKLATNFLIARKIKILKVILFRQKSMMTLLFLSLKSIFSLFLIKVL